MAEALQRFAGISLETDSGEGRFINIRGLDSDLNANTYAGVRLPASNRPRRLEASAPWPRHLSYRHRRGSRGHQDPASRHGRRGVGWLGKSRATHRGPVRGPPFLEAISRGPLRAAAQDAHLSCRIQCRTSFSGGDGIGGLFAGADAFSVVITAVFHSDQRGIDDLEESYTDNKAVAYRTRC